MAKRRKPGPDKQRAAARQRAARRADPWDFRFKLPLASPEVLERITPLHPRLCLESGQLAHSPAQTWLQLGDNASIDDELRDTIARWPFQIARPGQEAGGWVCLALLAYEQHIDISDLARHTAELEDQRLLVWSSEHNVLMMGLEVADLHADDPESVRRLDDTLARTDAETPAERAQRRWLHPTVVPRETTDPPAPEAEHGEAG